MKGCSMFWREQTIAYFTSLADVFYKHGTPDTLQGGISIIRNPHLYDDSTLGFWYGECKRAGY